jgi:hypothetical protein
MNEVARANPAAVAERTLETRNNAMNEEMTRLIQQLVEQERARLEASALPEVPSEPMGIHYSELPLDDSNEQLAQEWNVYCRSVGRLLAEGWEGRYVLIKGEEIIGLYDDWAAARLEGLTRFLREPFFVHVIRAVEPHLNTRGINRPRPV